MKLRLCLLGILSTFVVAMAVEPLVRNETGHAQFSPPAPVEFVQLIPFTTIAPNQTAFFKVGTLDTSELMPCGAATKVWTGGSTTVVRLESYCRIQSDGYAYVVFKNAGIQPISVYDRLRVVVHK